MGEFQCPRIMLTKTRFVTQNLRVQYERQNGSVLCKLCMIHDRERNGTKLAEMEELQCPRLMLTNTRFVTQNLRIQYKTQNGSVLCKLRMIHDRDRIGAKQAQMGELQCPRLMLTNTRFVAQNLLIEYESQNGLVLCKLCTIHDRERNGAKLEDMGELQCPRLMPTNTRFVTQNLLVEYESQNDYPLHKFCTNLVLVGQDGRIFVSKTNANSCLICDATFTL